MNRIITAGILYFISSLTIDAQTNTDSVLIRIENFKKILDQADTLSSEEATSYNDEHTVEDESEYDINDTIADWLIGILNNPAISKYDLDSLLNHDFLNIVHSADKSLWIFNWPVNNGGTWEMICNVFHCRTQSGKISNEYVNPNSGESLTSACSSGSWFDKIFKLQSKNKNLYLCISSNSHCSSCCSDIASVMEITSDNIKYDYPAFKYEGNQLSSCYMIDSRCGDTEKFEYDSESQTIHFQYSTDDITPIERAGDENSKTVSGTLRWNGVNFIEKLKMK